MAYNVFVKVTNNEKQCSDILVWDKPTAEELEPLIVKTGCGFEIFDTYGGKNLPLEWLPEEILKRVKTILKAYRVCVVVYEYGTWNVGTSEILKSEYAVDYCIAGWYNVDEVYTKEEQEKNYKEVFG